MYRWRFTLTIEDEGYAESEYEAWTILRNRVIDRFYGPTKEQVEMVEEVLSEEPTTESP